MFASQPSAPASADCPLAIGRLLRRVRREAERVRAFIKQKGGCRATYFNHAQKLGRSVDLPEIRLNNRPPEQTTASLLDLLRRRFKMLGRDEPQ